MRFEDNFWGSSADKLFGIKKLNSHFDTGIAQIDNLSKFIKELIFVQEWYSKQLFEIGKNDPVTPESESSEDSFTKIITQVKSEVLVFADKQKEMGSSLKRTLYNLHKFKKEVDESTQIRNVILFASHDNLKEAQHKIQEKQRIYNEKCKFSDIEYSKLDSTTSPTTTTQDIYLTMGLVKYSVDEFNLLLSKMKRDIPVETVKSLISATKECFKGEDMINFLKSSVKLSEGNSIIMCNDLITNGFIKSISRGTGFMVTNKYQWQQPSQRKPSIKTSLDNDYLVAKKESDKADHEYKLAVTQAKNLRCVYENQYYEFLTKCEDFQFRKSHIMKKVLLDFNADFFKPQNTSAYEKISLLLETYEPEKEVQVIVERDKTGLQHLKPFLYNNYYYGVRPCLDDHNGLSTGFTMQVFGVDLDEICGFAKRNVPLFLVKLLRSVVRESDIQVQTSHIQSEIDIWLESISLNIQSIHNLKTHIENALETTNLTKIFKKFPLSTLIGLIKIYLFELPDSVVSNEIYEPLKILYLSKSEQFDTSKRINSLKSLLSTLSSAHYHTLVTLFTHWHNIIEKLDPTDARINTFLNLLGPMILRPKIESDVTIHDKHPARLVKDLVFNCKHLLTESSLVVVTSNPEPASSDSEEEEEEEVEQVSTSVQSFSIQKELQELDDIIMKDINLDSNEGLVSSSFRLPNVVGLEERLGDNVISSPMITRGKKSEGDYEEDFIIQSDECLN